MDWSILSPHAKHSFLRENLIYTNTKPVRGQSLTTQALRLLKELTYRPITLQS